MILTTEVSHNEFIYINCGERPGETLGLVRDLEDPRDGQTGREPTFFESLSCNHGACFYTFQHSELFPSSLGIDAIPAWLAAQIKIYQLDRN